MANGFNLMAPVNTQQPQKAPQAGTGTQRFGQAQQTQAGTGTQRFAPASVPSTPQAGTGTQRFGTTSAPQAGTGTQRFGATSAPAAGTGTQRFGATSQAPRTGTTGMSMPVSSEEYMGSGVSAQDAVRTGGPVSDGVPRAGMAMPSASQEYMTTGGNATAQSDVTSAGLRNPRLPTAPGHPPPTPTVPGSPGNPSPISLMDWQGQLAHGDTNAANRTVQDNETVAHQLNNLTNSNSQYIQNARLSANEQSADRGMLFSSVAAGASQRAAIDAAMPIAQQDASTYANTASENMAATNADRLADQSMYGNLLGQAVGIRANLDEAERSRGWQGDQNQLNRDHATSERVGSQQWQGVENQLQREHDLVRQQQDQLWQSYEQALTRNFQGNENSKQFLQQRFLQFDASMQNYNNQLMQTLSAIYQNPNLTASQQASAASNARAVHQSLFNSYAATMSAGLPEIYWDPYPGGAFAPVQPSNPGQPVNPAPPGGGGGGGGSGNGPLWPGTFELAP